MRYQAKYSVMESVNTFLAVCRAVGCKKEDLFTVADLTETHDAERVARGLLALKKATMGGKEAGEIDPLVQTLRTLDAASPRPRKKSVNGRKRRSSESSVRSLDEAETMDGGYGEVWPDSPAGNNEGSGFREDERSPRGKGMNRSDSVTSNSSVVSAYGSSLTALGVKSPEEFDTIRKFARRLAAKDRLVKDLTGAIQAANDREERMRARVEELSDKLQKSGNGNNPLSRQSSAGTVTSEQMDALVGDIRRQLAETKSELVATKRARDQARAECEEARRQCAEFRTDLEIAQKEVFELEGGEKVKVERILKDLEEKNKQLEEARAANQRLESQRQRAEKSVRKKEKQLRALLQVAQGLREGLARVRNDFEGFRVPMLGDMERIAAVGESLREMGEKYDGLRKENKRLHNDIIDLKGNIRVFCRVRPISQKELRDGAFAATTCPGDDVILVKQQQGTKAPTYKFSFDQVYGGTATQEEVFAEVEGIIRSVIDGYNVCIFAYGQTGSGKTHTMSGPSGQLNSKTVGVNYRALDLLFALREERSGEWDFDIGVEMVEIYNETIRDLLMDVSHTGKDSKDRKKLQMRMREDGNRSADATRISVSTPEDVLAVMDSGSRNRATGSTSMNERSSRSHCIVTVRVDGLHKSTAERLSSSLHLVDLAGSERISKSEATGDRLKEAQHINKSLSALGDVIQALVEKRPHVPFRNSKLTQILQTSLGGQSKALMFAHVSPESGSTSETVSTLNFAQRVKQVELGKASQNKGTLAEMKTLISEKERELQEMDARVREAEARGGDEARALVESELQSKDSELGSLRHKLQVLEQENRALKSKAEQAQKQVEEPKRRALSKPPALQIPIGGGEITFGDGERTPNGTERPKRRSHEAKVAKNLEIRRRSSGRNSDNGSESSDLSDSIPLTPRKRGEGSSIPLPASIMRAGARERTGTERNGRRSSGENSASEEEISGRIFAAGKSAQLERNASVPSSPTGHRRPVTAGARVPGARRRSSDTEGVSKTDAGVSAQKRPATAAPPIKVPRPVQAAGGSVVRKPVEPGVTAGSKTKASTRPAAGSSVSTSAGPQAKIVKAGAAPGKIWA